ncbi:hypothetical protein ACN28S_57520 [Cystobacter fuscus]
MLAFGGVVGFSGLWGWISVAVFLTVRTYHRAREPIHRAGALVAMAVIVAYTNQCFGDMGTISWLGTLLIAMAATCVGKVATLTGAGRAQGSRKHLSLFQLGKLAPKREILYDTAPKAQAATEI